MLSDTDGGQFKILCNKEKLKREKERKKEKEEKQKERKSPSISCCGRTHFPVYCFMMMPFSFFDSLRFHFFQQEHFLSF